MRNPLEDEMFRAAEEQRAASLRQSIDMQGELASHLPEEYSETLARLRSAEVALMRSEAPETRNAVTVLLNRISEMESRAGLQLVAREPSSTEPISIRAAQNRLTPSQVLFCLYAGQRQSYLWAITASGSTLHSLSARQQLLDASRRFAKAVNSGSPDSAAQAGRRFFGELFGSVPASALAKPEWLIVPDTPLFEAPLAALIVPAANGAAPEYLVERHSLRLLPGTWALFDKRGHGPQDDTSLARDGFIGLGDSVYNKADARWNGRPPQAMPIENARLVGSAREIEACGRLYAAPQTILLTGWDASRSRLESAVAGRPDVLHLAAHVLHTPGPNASALIHLGSRPSGEPDVLNPSDIVFLSGSPRLVVMSGCASGFGEAIPGEGLMGLTRAWLINGSEAVAASYWPTTDDQGEIFLSFYRHLAKGRPATDAPSVASALRAAQLEMLRSNSWRAVPRYWAAFFVIGRS
jgi:CHAT domain-containing protein